MGRVEVAVVGAGIVGLAVARELQARGVRVAVFERDGIGAGASGVQAGGVRQQSGTRVALRLAREFWDDVENRLDALRLSRCGYLFGARTEETLARLEANVALQNEEGVPSRIVSAGEAAELVPGLQGDAIAGGAWCADDGYFDRPQSVGTWRPRAAAFAREVADEVKIGGCANPGMVRLMRTWLGDDGPKIVIGAVTVVDEDGDAARAHAAAQVQMYLDVVGGLDPTLDLRPGESPPLEKFVLAGTPEEVAAQAGELYDAGVHRVEFGTPQGLTNERGVALLCDRVLPLLR